ncbi:ChaN family lipoprotein [Limibacter armeniacum]|uniref:ChaN family lipoprotein n=1 Tax=Limibacter armeniacum TaxID=466084 RepID=UPI002FE5ECE7
MKKLRHYCLLIITLLMMANTTQSQDLKAFVIFDKEGKEISYGEMVKSLEGADAVFFGELHNNPIAHWLELEVTHSLFEAKGKDLLLGAEMFERDAQQVLDEYLAGIAKEAYLIKDGKAWDNYATDYSPLVEFAKANGLKFYATNVPRRYASLVAKQGLSALEELDKEVRKNYLPKLPIEVDFSLPSYKNMMAMMGGHGHGMQGAEDMAKNMVAAQAIKDATMGATIAEAIKREKGTFLHYNGSYHSNYKEGTVWYLLQKMPKLTVVNINVVEVNDVNTFDTQNKETADFVIQVTERMTKTY